MNRRNIIIIVSLFVFVMIVGGVSYSYFVYNKDIGDVSLTAGEISIDLSGISGNKTLTNVIPISDNEGMISQDYFDFTVNATVDTERIYYEVYLLPDSGNTLDTSYLKTYLTDQTNNAIKGITLFSDLSDSEVENGKVLYKGVIETNQNGTTRNETKAFRLRLWLDETYTELTSKSFNFDVYLYAKNVDDDFVLPGFRNLIASKVSETYAASYDDIINDPSNVGFTTQDQVSTNAPKQTVYYYTGDDAAANANVLFAGYCWQIIRTTDNGGVRMIYNGVAVNNKCETTRTATKGINGTNGTSTSLSGATLFGRSYDYDLDTGVFTIQDSNGLPTAWNDTNYKDLIGTYTCNNSSSTCTTLYYVGSYASSTSAYVASYTIGDVDHFSQIGKSAFNPNIRVPAMVGYMFNEEYKVSSSLLSNEYHTNAVWNSTTSTYELSSPDSATSLPDATHHYSCYFNNDCTKVGYYYYVSGSHNILILLENGELIEDAIYKMTGNGDNGTLIKNTGYKLNNYNSAIKGYLDNWYEKNLATYASYLDQSSVYCNDRSIRDLGGWNSNGTSITLPFQFYQYNPTRNLNCVNETDRFAKTNTKAELTYPIGLLTEPERNLMTANFAKTGQLYCVGSPNYYVYTTNNGYNTYIRCVDASGSYSSKSAMNSNGGVRGVVTLKPDTMLDGGTGTYTDPYIVGPIVTRNE